MLACTSLKAGLWEVTSQDAGRINDTFAQCLEPPGDQAQTRANSKLDRPNVAPQVAGGAQGLRARVTASGRRRAGSGSWSQVLCSAGATASWVGHKGPLRH